MKSPPSKRVLSAVGLDLGQAQDYTAVAVVQRIEEDGQPAVYHARRVERLQLGTPYPQIVRYIGDLLQHPELAGAALVVDAMGVGAAPVDMLREGGLAVQAVKVHGGAEERRGDDGSWHVPKRNLVSTLRLLLEHRELKIAATAPNAAEMIEELLAYRLKLNARGHDSYEAWREADHDDLVFALGIASWFLRRHSNAGPAAGPAHPALAALAANTAAVPEYPRPAFGGPSVLAALGGTRPL